jgi:hypothetical protein
VTVLNRFRPYFLLIAALPALAAVHLLGPIGWQGGVLLILYGSWIGDIHGRLNPRPDLPEDPQPWLPWNRLGAGEKLEYLLPTLLMIALGALGTTAILLAGGTGIKHWLTLACWLAFVAMGAWDLRRRWLRRWGALESE